MTCYAPVKVGINRKPVVPGGARYLDAQMVPCGHCLGCRADQARDWSIRIMHETQMHDFSWFLTLTYSDERIPEYGSLCPTDLQRFFKTLRRQYPPSTVSYFSCGEYGESTQRPHYHAVLFGADFLDRCFLRFSGDSPVWRSASLESYWPHGLSEFGTVTPASAAYVAGYVRKKLRKKDHPDAYTAVVPETGELVELEKEFSRMSLNPAIGKRWLERYWRDVYPRDYVVMDGRQYSPPRYYDKWAEMDHVPPCPGGCRSHQEAFFQARVKRYEEMEDLAPEKLEAKQKIHAARTELYGKRNKI